MAEKEERFHFSYLKPVNSNIKFNIFKMTLPKTLYCMHINRDKLRRAKRFFKDTNTYMYTKL